MTQEPKKRPKVVTIKPYLRETLECYAKGMKGVEIAKKLGVSPGAIHQRLKRAAEELGLNSVRLLAGWYEQHKAA